MPGKYGGDKTRQITRTIKFYPVDDELITFIAEHLGSSRSDAIRTAVRAYAMHIEMLERGRR